MSNGKLALILTSLLVLTVACLAWKISTDGYFIGLLLGPCLVPVLFIGSLLAGLAFGMYSQQSDDEED